MAGGRRLVAFPTNAALLDDFNRADVGPPPSASWTDKVLTGDSAGLKVTSNQLACASAGGNRTAWLNTATYGPDCEFAITIPTLPTGYFGIFARVANPGVIGVTGYIFYMIGSTSAEFYRFTGNTYTILGAAISQTWAAGDSIGFEIIGSILTGYRKNGGIWASVGTRTDSTYTGAGYPGLYAEDVTVRADDFTGGVVLPVFPRPVMAPPIAA